MVKTPTQAGNEHLYIHFFHGIAEEKWPTCILLFRMRKPVAALLFCFSFERLSTTSVVPKISGFTSSEKSISRLERRGAVNLVSLHIQHSIAARVNNWNLYDVTRLVATEHMWNKYSLLESLLLNIVALFYFIDSFNLYSG